MIPRKMRSNKQMPKLKLPKKHQVYQPAKIPRDAAKQISQISGIGAVSASALVTTSMMGSVKMITTP